MGPERKLATSADIAGRWDDERLEIVHGDVVEKAGPSWRHSGVQSAVCSALHRRFHRRGPGGPGPGGWWILTEVDTAYGPHELYRHDVAGWRRERVALPVAERPVRIRPDWACEVISESNAKRDLVDKFLVLQRCGVPHYWVVDPEERALIVYRLDGAGYRVVLSAGPAETVRAEPFEAVELRTAVLFGDEDEE